MPTMLVRLFIDNVLVGLFRTLNDGGAEANLVDYDTIRDWYHKSIPSKTNIVGLGNHDLAVTNRINVKLLPWGTDGITVDTTFWILPKRNKWSPIYPTGDVPPLAIKGKLEAPLADPFFWKSAPVHLLLGIETLAAIAKENAPMQRVSDNLVTQPTIMGNVVYGRAGDQINAESTTVEMDNRLIQTVSLSELDKTLQKFWHFEDLPLCTKKDAENELVEELFAKTYSRADNGRHVVAIPMNPQCSQLPDRKF